MGADASGINAWLRGGGTVVAASERAARAIASAYHRTRQAEGLTAWPAPAILHWENFVRNAWEERRRDDCLLLTPVQEQARWAQIAAADSERASLLEGPLHRVAGLAMEAHRVLCLYAPQFLRASARASWQQDAGAFSGWLAAFEEACRGTGMVSASRLPLELITALAAETGPRTPLLLAGFDRILPMQRRLFDAWGEWREAPRSEPAAQRFFHQAPDEKTELDACALWCGRKLALDPKARLLVVTQDAAERRGEIERAFLRFAGGENAAADGRRLFEFSLGIPLQQVALARGALLVLRWLEGSIAEHELDWLISTGQLAADQEESRSLAALMRALRRRGRERTRWLLNEWLDEWHSEFSRQNPAKGSPSRWAARMSQTKRRLEEFTRRTAGSSRRAGTAAPAAWAELAPQLLQLAGWPGSRALTSAEFQAMNRWQQALDTCASLGFDGRWMAWRDFLNALERVLNEMLFAPESEDAPILIAGPAESAGLTADAIWFLGATADAWPAPGAAHPLIPLDVQRTAEMPHASAQLDWGLAAAVTERLLSAAPEIYFSSPRQCEGVEARPSRLILKAAGPPQNVPPDLTAPETPDALTISFEDLSRIPFPGGELRGGSSVLSAQSQCAFKAFATARLGAQAWEPAQPGLTAAQRGKLLHAVLHSVWAGPPGGMRSHAELLEPANLKRTNLAAFVEEHVRAVFMREMPAGVRERMPRRYLELEEIRLAHLVTEWLQFEAARVPFLVEDTEVDREVAIAGLALHLRLDRLDRLNDGTLLVIDYKTGNVSSSSWQMPRPDDVQLPLYAGFALDRETEPLGGLVFAKIRAGERSFAGRVFDPCGQLHPGLSKLSALANNRLEIDDLLAWRAYIEKMARDFIEGRADVNPREYPKTCERCGLQALCRVDEFQPHFDEDGADGEEVEDA